MNLYRVVYDSGSYFVEAPSFGKAIEAWQAWAAKNWEDDGWEGTEQPESVELLDSDHAVIRVKVPPVYECPCAKTDQPCVCGMTTKAPPVQVGDQIKTSHDNWKDAFVVVERMEGRLGRDFRASPADGRPGSGGTLGPNGTFKKNPLIFGFSDYEEGRLWHRTSTPMIRVVNCISCGHPLTSLQGPPYYACEWNPCPRFYLRPTTAPPLPAVPDNLMRPAPGAAELDDERRGRRDWTDPTFF